MLKSGEWYISKGHRMPKKKKKNGKGEFRSSNAIIPSE
jgi:hypothetical protein